MRTHLVLVIITLCTLLISTVHAEEMKISWSIQEKNIVTRAGMTPIVDLYMTARTNRSPLGVFAWSVYTPGWTEVVTGVTFAPASWIELAVGGGVEEASKPLRVAGSLWIGDDRYSLYALGEIGGTAPWYTAVGTVRASQQLGVGALSQRDVGTGPYMQMRAGSVTLWIAAPLVNSSDRHMLSGLVGLKLSFEGRE